MIFLSIPYKRWRKKYSNTFSQESKSNFNVILCSIAGTRFFVSSNNQNVSDFCQIHMQFQHNSEKLKLMYFSDFFHQTLPMAKSMSQRCKKPFWIPFFSATDISGFQRKINVIMKTLVCGQKCHCLKQLWQHKILPKNLGHNQS